MKQNEKSTATAEQNNNECYTTSLTSNELEEFQNDLNYLYIVIEQVAVSVS